jgi:hypothetical protein
VAVALVSEVATAVIGAVGPPVVYVWATEYGLVKPVLLVYVWEVGPFGSFQ